MKKITPFLLIFATVLVLYYTAIFTYFSQDDFFHFMVSKTDDSLAGFLNLFGFYPFDERGIAFYRPIFREGLYNIFYSIFGLNPLPFRLLSFAIHFINIYLVFILMEKLFQKKSLAFFVAFFFGVSAANVAPLYYLAGGIQALGATMFILLALITYINYLKKPILKLGILTFVWFVLGLASHELATITLFLLVGLTWVYGKPKNLLASSLKLWPFFLLLIIYLYLNITKIGLSPGEQQYQAVFNIKTTLQSFTWYIAWAFGFPEMLLDFVLPGLKLNPDLMKYWGGFYKVIFSSGAVAVILLGFTTLYSLRKKEIFKDKRFWFLVLWFPLSLLSVIFLPSHKSSYYLVPALPAFWGVVGYLIFHTFWELKKRKQILAITFLGTSLASLFLLQITSAKLGETTFWAAQRGKLAEKLITQVKSAYPSLPKGSVIYFTNDPSYPFVAKDWGGTSKQAAFALNNKDALRLLYKDFTLEVYYEDLGGVPKDFSMRVYELVAKLNY